MKPYSLIEYHVMNWNVLWMCYYKYVCEPETGMIMNCDFVILTNAWRHNHHVLVEVWICVNLDKHHVWVICLRTYENKDILNLNKENIIYESYVCEDMSMNVYYTWTWRNTMHEVYACGCLNMNVDYLCMNMNE